MYSKKKSAACQTELVKQRGIKATGIKENGRIWMQVIDEKSRLIDDGDETDLVARTYNDIVLDEFVQSFLEEFAVDGLNLHNYISMNMPISFLSNARNYALSPKNESDAITHPLAGFAQIKEELLDGIVASGAGLKLQFNRGAELLDRLAGCRAHTDRQNVHVDAAGRRIDGRLLQRLTVQSE